MPPTIKLFKPTKPALPKWLIQLYAPSGAGKTLLAAMFPGAKLVFDSDGRFLEQSLPDDEIYFAYETAAENTKIGNITTALEQVMPGNKDIEVIIIDTMTTPFQELVDETERLKEQAQSDKSLTRKASTHKATVMKALRRQLFGYGKHVIMIFHTHERGDQFGKRGIAKTLSDIELGRFDMFTNQTLKIVVDEDTGKHGVLIERNRFGHSGITVWDDEGNWRNFWAKLEAEAYKGLSRADMERIAASTPTSFSDKSAAWAWGMEQGCFKDIKHAAAAMEKMIRENETSGDEPELWADWIKEVQSRKARTPKGFADGTIAVQWGFDQGCFTTLAAAQAAYDKIKIENKPKSAQYMFSLWINHVIELKDQPVAAQVEPVVEEPADLLVEEPADLPVEQSFSEASAVSKIFSALQATYADKNLTTDQIEAMESWLIGKYTFNATPDKVRNNAAALTADEIKAVLAGIEKNGERYLRQFNKESAEKQTAIA